MQFYRTVVIFILQHVIVGVEIGTKVVNRYDHLMVELANTAIRVSIFCHVECVQKGGFKLSFSLKHFFKIPPSYTIFL